ncbi:hypothetical protein [Arthrobacter woluwensis]|uniref:Uncharacterized protein n=1 Tax=Arthrobacter woluwensis TaxID=156980 RepID=A0A1H4I7Z0_9MICC|nr:hypothetical protein [Arthrobacter woluwensis]SEB30093.1 hypothetical protein SAMN04489745_0108 [Arthrobacter woluwensis]
MALSLGRKHGRSRAPYAAYLRSQAWAWRRQRYFRDLRRKGIEPCCMVCAVTLTENGTLDLHHLNYTGVVINPDGSFKAAEKDQDLIPLCRAHHEHLHRLLDTRDYYGWDRGRASRAALLVLKRQLARRRPR